MKFRSKKKLFVYFDEYSYFHVYCDELAIKDMKLHFFINKKDIADIPMYSLHHIEYFNSVFDIETVYISKTEL